MNPLLHQSAAVPIRYNGNEIQIMLVTSRDTGRWVLPKGNIKKGFSARKSAAQEAFEEAGIKGDISKSKYGFYKYLKAEIPANCIVELYLMHVTEELSRWPEKTERKRKWFSAKEASAKVREKKLSKLLRALHKDKELALAS